MAASGYPEMSCKCIEKNVKLNEKEANLEYSKKQRKTADDKPQTNNQ